MNRMEKYHADYVSQRKAPPLVAVTPAAMERLSGPVSLYAAISALAAGIGFAMDAMPGSAPPQG